MSSRILQSLRLHTFSFYLFWPLLMAADRAFYSWANFSYPALQQTFQVDLSPCGLYGKFSFISSVLQPRAPSGLGSSLVACLNSRGNRHSCFLCVLGLPALSLGIYKVWLTPSGVAASLVVLELPSSVAFQVKAALGAGGKAGVCETPQRFPLLERLCPCAFFKPFLRLS